MTVTVKDAARRQTLTLSAQVTAARRKTCAGSRGSCSAGTRAVPTETVYGLAANAFDAAACRQFSTPKRRPPTIR